MDRRTAITATVIVLAAFAGGRLVRSQQAAGTHVPRRTAPPGYALVTRVVDGDTIEVDGGRKVRYLGMDTPETVDPRKAVQCFGHEASEYNRSLVQDQFVRLVRDVEDTDRYGRLLRYIYREDGTFVNLKLVADGYAHVYTWPPNVAHTQEFVAAQASARTAGRGLWSACPPLHK